MQLKIVLFLLVADAVKRKNTVRVRQVSRYSRIIEMTIKADADLEDINHLGLVALDIFSLCMCVCVCVSATHAFVGDLYPLQ